MSIRTRFRRLRVAGALRVLALLVVIQLLAVGLWLGSAHARANEALLSVASELMQIEGARPNQPARSVFINGVTVRLRTASTDQDVHAVLNRFHALCRQRAGVDAPQAVLDKLRADGAKGSSSPGLLDGVLRTESDSVGALACIDTRAKLSLAELTPRLQDFAKSGDLDAVGDLRYVLAHRVAGKTAVLMLWTEGATPLLKMFPALGDAPGRDPLGIPRAPNTRRLLSTWEEGEPYSFTVYTVPDGALKSLGDFYRAELARAGWQLEQRASGSNAIPASVVIARRGGETVVVRVGSSANGKDAVTVAVMD